MTMASQAESSSLPTHDHTSVFSPDIRQSDKRKKQPTHHDNIPSTALVFTVVAAGASLICSVAVGLNLGPLQARAASGLRLPTDATVLVKYLTLVATNILWTVFGFVGLILGILTVVREVDRVKGIAAIVIAALAPVVSFTVWLTLTLMTSPLGQPRSFVGSRHGVFRASMHPLESEYCVGA